MKRVTASDARKNWFRLLDEVAAGEVVCIDRGGRRILLQREAEQASDAPIPDYAPLLQVAEAAEADAWRWSWEGPERDLRLTDDAGG